MDMPIPYFVALTALALVMGALTVGSVLMWWFNTALPVHVFKVLRRMGLMKDLPWPEDVDYEMWLRHEWADWAAMHLPEIWAEGLNCPGCFANPTSAVAAIGYVMALGLPWWMVFPLWACYPSAGNMVLAKTTR